MTMLIVLGALSVLMLANCLGYNRQANLWTQENAPKVAIDYVLGMRLFFFAMWAILFALTLFAAFVVMAGR